MENEILISPAALPANNPNDSTVCVHHTGWGTKPGSAAIRGIWVGLALAFLVSTVATVRAQIRSGTITGLVTDPKGAVIVGAEVTVTNADTHVTNTTTTTQTGLYTVPYLATGTYSVSVSKPGFAKETINGISLNPSQIARADATLQVGATSSVVQVQASAEQLQTESSTISQSIDPIVVASIPNVTQNPLYFLTLQNNVQARRETYDSQTVNSTGVGVAGRADLSSALRET